MIGDLLDGWEILFSGIKMVDGDLVHSDIHYGAIRPVPVVTWEVRLADRRGVGPNSAAVLFFHLLVWLENWG